MQCRGLLELGLLSTVRSKARRLLAVRCSPLLAEKMDLIFIIFPVAPILDLHTSLSASVCSCLGKEGRNRKDPGKVWRPEQGDVGEFSLNLCAAIKHCRDPLVFHIQIFLCLKTISQSVLALCSLGTLALLAAVM